MPENFGGQAKTLSDSANTHHNVLRFLNMKFQI